MTGPSSARAPIPLTVIGGFLGAGKTTLVNRLLAGEHGERLMVLINDFGEINIDAALIADRGAGVIALTNGCVCCSLGGDLAATLMRVRAAAEPPDHLIIEASGVSNPGKIAQIGLAGNAFRLGAVVVLADAAEVRRHARDRYVGTTVTRQIASADLILLNKCDLVEASDLKSTRAWLSALVPDVPVIETTEARIGAEIILGAVAQPRAGGEDPATSHDHLHGISSWSIRLKEGLSRDAFLRFAGNIPPEVLRAKGFVPLREADGGLHVFQLVGRRWTLAPAGMKAATSGIVFISYDGDEAEARLASLLDEQGLRPG
jgi:G3E family GTPase